MPFLPDLDVDGLDDRIAPYYWQRYGESDGQQGNPKRVIADPRFQYQYNIGWNEGSYFRLQLSRDTI